MKTRAHVFVSGRVQGVFFRAHTRGAAQDNNVSGWVRNLPDGRVEAVLEGDEADVEKAIEDIRAGPPHSIVDNLEIKYEAYLGEFRAFEVKYF